MTRILPIYICNAEELIVMEKETPSNSSLEERFLDLADLEAEIQKRLEALQSPFFKEVHNIVSVAAMDER